MRFFITVLSATVLAAPIFATPTPLLAVEKYDGETTGRYIVRLKEGASTNNTISTLNLNATHHWQNFRSFAAIMSEDDVNTLRASPEVESIHEDGVMYTTAITQNNAPWGIARLSSATKLSNQDPNALSFSYTYDESAGSGVDIYIVDSGVNIQHEQFGGRARWGATFGGYADADGRGHGTHCAGIAAASQFGVAKAANIIAVKVMSDQGTGTGSDIISGLDFVITSARNSGRPSIASMSVGGGATSALDGAVESTTSAGVHVVVSAGNDNTDASSNSPARAPSAVTVGSIDITDTFSSFSNFGSLVDVFAPGENILSTWIGSTTASMADSGTSMATPHVAGLIAYLISTSGNRSPADMSARVKDLSLKGAITGLPSGTPDDLAHL